MRSKHNKRASSTVLMSELLPTQIGEIVTDGAYKGVIVMRTASTENYEVMNMTNAGDNQCWTTSCCVLKVRLFVKGESLTLFQE